MESNYPDVEVSYEFEENLLNIINNHKNRKEGIFKTVNIEIGNTQITKKLKEAFND